MTPNPSKACRCSEFPRAGHTTRLECELHTKSSPLQAEAGTPKYILPLVIEISHPKSTALQPRQIVVVDSGSMEDGSKVKLAVSLLHHTDFGYHSINELSRSHVESRVPYLDTNRSSTDHLCFLIQ